MKKTAAQEAARDKHMDNAMDYTLGIIRDNAMDYTLGIIREADLRGLDGADVAVAIATVMASCNPMLAGKVLVAVSDAIRLNPITKIITPAEATVQ
jgi:hypothetical protein